MNAAPARFGEGQIEHMDLRVIACTVPVEPSFSSRAQLDTLETRRSTEFASADHAR